jgi:hypothetical protein
MAVVGLGSTAAVLSVVAAPDVSRRAAASIVQVNGVSAGALGVLPANGLPSGARRFSIAVVTTVTRLGGAAVVDTVGCWSCGAGARTCDVAAVEVADGVTAAATGVTATTPTGPECAAALVRAAVPEVRVPDASVLVVGTSEDEVAALGTRF